MLLQTQFVCLNMHSWKTCEGFMLVSKKQSDIRYLWYWNMGPHVAHVISPVTSPVSIICNSLADLGPSELFENWEL